MMRKSEMLLAAGGAGPDGYYSPPGERLLTVPGTCDRSTRRHVLDWLQSSVALPSALLRRSHGGCCMGPAASASLCCLSACWHAMRKLHTWACPTRLPVPAAQVTVNFAVIHDLEKSDQSCALQRVRTVALTASHPTRGMALSLNH